MTPDDQGRFCVSCQKSVIDFSRMNDRELIAFFNRPAGSMCGRFLPAQLDRAIEAPPKKIPWTRYFFAVALPAFLVSCKLAAQQAVQGKMVKTEQRITGDTVALPAPRTVGDVAALPKDTDIVPVPPLLMGKIVRPRIGSDSALMKSTPVKKASINRCKVQPITADSNCFVRPPFAYPPALLTIKELQINRPQTEDYIVTVGGFSVSRVYRTRTLKTDSGLPAVVVKKQVPASFSIYPNPVQAGAAFILDGKNLEGGIYQLTVVNTSGQLIQSEELMLQSKASKETIQLKDVRAGVYFVELSNKKGRVFSKKILVQ